MDFDSDDLIEKIASIVTDSLVESLNNNSRGHVRVAKYYPKTGILPPTRYPDGDYVNVLIHTKPGGLGGDLSPYVLRDEQNRLLENVWQFSKVYDVVQAQSVPLNRYQPSRGLIWSHPAEKHWNSETNEPTNEYWLWRRKGETNKYAVRYPAGYLARHKVKFCLWNNSGKWQRLGYIAARKKIYVGEYVRLTKNHPAFGNLQKMVNSGTNIQLVEVDGPDPGFTTPEGNYFPYTEISLKYPGLLLSEDVVKTLVNDPKKPFGHGFVIGSLLLGGQSWME